MNSQEIKWKNISRLAQAAADFSKGDDSNIILQVFLNSNRKEPLPKIKILSVLEIMLNTENFAGFDDETPWCDRNPYLKVNFFYHVFGDENEEVIIDENDFPRIGYAIIQINNNNLVFPSYTTIAEDLKKS